MTRQWFASVVIAAGLVVCSAASAQPMPSVSPPPPAAPPQNVSSAQCIGGKTEAGLIETVQGLLSGMWIERGGARIRPKAWGLVCENDMIFIGAEGYLRYRAIDGTEVPLLRRSGEPPLDHEVRAPLARSAAINALLSAWRQLFPQIDRLGVQTIGRSPDNTTLRWPIAEMASGMQRLAPAERELLLVWQGGIAPFTVSLVDPVGRVRAIQLVAAQPRPAVEIVEAARQSAITYARSARMPAINLAPGMWRVEVKDAEGVMLSGQVSIDADVINSVDAVRVARGPSAGIEFAEIEAGLDAVGLVQSSPALALEALQRLPPQGEGLDRNALVKTIACMSFQPENAPKECRP
jgi:hypothetical protein